MLRKNLTKIAILFCACAVVFVCAGCSAFSGGNNSSDVEKAARTTYFAQVNNLSKEFNNVLGDFQSNVKNKDVQGMQDKYKESQNLLEEFSKIQVPADCQDVQKAYTDGYLQMQKALSDYIQIYSDFVNAQISNDVLNQRVEGVQKSYDEGLELLKNADKMASEK